MVEYFATNSRFGFLVRQQSVFQMSPEDRFHPVHRRLYQGSAMITDPSLPAVTTVLADAANRFVSRQRRLLVVAVLRQHRVFLRRNHRIDIPFRQFVIRVPRVENAIPVKLFHRGLHLVQHFRNGFRVVNAVGRQLVGDDLLIFRIDHQIQLPPCPTLAFTVRSYLPFTLAVHFQAGAVDHEVDRTAIFRNVNVDAEFRRTFRERREIGNRQIDLQQCD